jgi:hypothetical protein
MQDDVAANITKPAKSAKEPSVMAMKQAPIEAIGSIGHEVNKSQAMQPMPENNQSTLPQH